MDRSGIGFETAALFAKEGAKVVCADLNEAGAQKAVAKINQTVGDGTAIAVKVDVSKEAEIQALVEKAVDTYGKEGACLYSLMGESNTYCFLGKLDIMFNNAGIMHPEDDNALNTEERIW